MKDSEILVSICSITYNHAPYIRQCLDGFLMQQTTFKFEIIIHDDCSTDGTKEIIEEYVAKYPNLFIPIFQAENQYSKGVRGMFATFVFPRAKGRYIAMCEGDDYWIDPLKLQKQVDFLENNPDYSMCFHNALVIYQNRNIDAHVFCKQMHCDKDILLQEIVKDWIIPTASIVYRKNIFPLPVWASKIYSGDMTLALWAYSKGKVFYFSNIMSFYRKTDAGISNYAVNPAPFIYSQRAYLFSLFNDETNGKYDKILSERISYYEKLSSFWKYRSKSLALAFIRMPLFFTKKIMIAVKRNL